MKDVIPPATGVSPENLELSTTSGNQAKKQESMKVREPVAKKTEIKNDMSEYGNSVNIRAIP